MCWIHHPPCSVCILPDPQLFWALCSVAFGSPRHFTLAAAAISQSADVLLRPLCRHVRAVLYPCIRRILLSESWMLLLGLSLFSPQPFPSCEAMVLKPWAKLRVAVSFWQAVGAPLLPSAGTCRCLASLCTSLVAFFRRTLRSNMRKTGSLSKSALQCCSILVVTLSYDCVAGRGQLSALGALHSFNLRDRPGAVAAVFLRCTL